MEDILKIINLTKKGGNKIILNNVNLNVHKGEILGIIGKSGSGKTTLLKTIVGFLVPEYGSINIVVNGKDYDIIKNKNIAKKEIGFAPQEPSFYPELTIEENLNYFGTLFELNKETLAQNSERLLKWVKLENSLNKKAQVLSGGMRKRLGLMISALHKPDLFVLDEPTADLDPNSRKHVNEFINQLNETGTTIIIASHHIEDLEDMCDRIAMINEGVIIKQGTVDELKKYLCDNKEIILKTKDQKYEEIVNMINIPNMNYKIYNKKLIIVTKEIQKTLPILLASIKRNNDSIIDIKIAQPSLNEIFDYVLGDN